MNERLEKFTTMDDSLSTESNNRGRRTRSNKVYKVSKKGMAKALDILQNMNRQRALSIQNVVAYKRITVSKRFFCTNSFPNYYSVLTTDPMMFSHTNICWRLIDCIIHRDWETLPGYFADFLKIYSSDKYEAVYRYLVIMMLHYPDRDPKDISTCLQLCFGCQDKMSEQQLLKEMLTFPVQEYPLDQDPTNNRAVLKAISKRKTRRKVIKKED